MAKASQLRLGWRNNIVRLTSEKIPSTSSLGSGGYSAIPTSRRSVPRFRRNSGSSIPIARLMPQPERPEVTRVSTSFGIDSDIPAESDSNWMPGHAARLHIIQDQTVRYSYSGFSGLDTLVDAGAHLRT